MSQRPRVVAFGLRGMTGVEGGIETHARQLYPRLVDLGMDVLVLVRHRYAAASAASPVATRRLWAPRAPGFETFVHSALAAIYCLVTRPDVVHIHAIGPGAFALPLRRAGLRVILTHHGHDYDAAKWGPIARTVLRWSERLSTRSAHAVIAVSESIARDLQRDFGVSSTVVRNGLPRWPERVADRPSRASLARIGDPYLLVVGRITAHKRILDVVQALAHPSLRHVRLVICGGRSGRDPYLRLVEEAARSDPRVVLAGHVEHDDLLWLYRHAACTVMPSSYEGMPLAVLEAVAAGCPVVLTTIPAHNELDLAASQYFRVGDIDELTQRLVGVLGHTRAEMTAVQDRCIGDPRYDWTHIAQASAQVMLGEPLDGFGSPTPSPTMEEPHGDSVVRE